MERVCENVERSAVVFLHLVVEPFEETFGKRFTEGLLYQFFQLLALLVLAVLVVPLIQRLKALIR